MAQAKSGPRLSTVLFCIAVFSLTGIGLAVFHYRMLALPFLFIFVYITAWALLFGFAVDSLSGKGKPSGKKVLTLTVGVMLTSALFTHSIWTITTPKWSFSVSTDRATYRLGEDVIIITSLRNMGFISHSFGSASSSPVVVGVEYQYSENPAGRYMVWYSPISRSVTGFAVGPGETLERSFLWNQTNIYHPEERIREGTYWIHALIPKDSSETIGFDNLFSAWTTMNITSG